MIIPMTDDERRLTEEYLYLVPEMVKKLTTRCAYVSYDEQQDLMQSIQRLLQQGKMKLFSDKERIYPTMTGKYPISAFFPISKKDEFGETLGLLLCTKNQQPFSEMDLGCAKMTAAAISRYIQQNYERTVI